MSKLDHAEKQHTRLNCQPNTPDAAAILASPDYFLCKLYNCRMSHSACTMRRKVARQQNEDGKDITFSKCLDCPVKESVVEKVCMVEGCGKKILSRLRCSTHYAQYRAEIKKRGPMAGEAKASPAPETTEPLFKVKPEALAARQKILAKRIPTTPMDGTKRVNVQFTGQDVALWEQLKARAKKNRRDLRTEALFIIEQALTVPEEPEVYR